MVTLTNGYSALAYPVYKVRPDLALIPAKYSDFCVLEKYKPQTLARNTIISFRKRAFIPTRSTAIPCIAVRMPSQAHEALKACTHDIRAALQAEKWTCGGEELDIIETGSKSKS